jgi:hypothetical protein
MSNDAQLWSCLINAIVHWQVENGPASRPQIRLAEGWFQQVLDDGAGGHFGPIRIINGVAHTELLRCDVVSDHTLPAETPVVLGPFDGYLARAGSHA